MGETRLGIACITNAENHLLGIVTDGDIRRKLLTVQKPFSAFLVDDAIDHSIRKPKITGPEVTLIAAVKSMEKFQIWDLPVVNELDQLVGLLHLHPAIKSLLGIN